MSVQEAAAVVQDAHARLVRARHNAPVVYRHGLVWLLATERCRRARTASLHGASGVSIAVVFVVAVAVAAVVVIISRRCRHRRQSARHRSMICDLCAGYLILLCLQVAIKARQYPDVRVRGFAAPLLLAGLTYILRRLGRTDGVPLGAWLVIVAAAARGSTRGHAGDLRAGGRRGVPAHGSHRDRSPHMPAETDLTRSFTRPRGCASW